MWHSAQSAEILRKYVCSSLVVARQRVHDSYPRKPTMRNCLYLGNDSVTTDISTATIDRRGYKRKATGSFKRVHDIPGQRQGSASYKFRLIQNYSSQ
jgi:hypothetical protein